MQTVVNEFEQTYTITDGEAYVMGYIYDGEVFYIFVPVSQRRQGIAKKLLQSAAKLVRERTGKELCFTRAISDEGKALVEWWNGIGANQ